MIDQPYRCKIKKEECFIGRCVSIAIMQWFMLRWQRFSKNTTLIISEKLSTYARNK
jgi:hypothetical protein